VFTIAILHYTTQLYALSNENDISFNTLVVQMCEFALLHLPSKGEKSQEDSKNGCDQSPS